VFIGTVGLVAFLAATPLALIATLKWRDRDRRPSGAVWRGDLYVPPPDATSPHR
jgi:hypothetical protein